MAKNDNNNNENSSKSEHREVLVNAQYVKDLSFESPNAPKILTQTKKFHG